MDVNNCGVPSGVKKREVEDAEMLLRTKTALPTAKRRIAATAALHSYNSGRPLCIRVAWPYSIFHRYRTLPSHQPSSVINSPIDHDLACLLIYAPVHCAAGALTFVRYEAKIRFPSRTSSLRWMGGSCEYGQEQHLHKDCDSSGAAPPSMWHHCGW